MDSHREEGQGGETRLMRAVREVCSLKEVPQEKELGMDADFLRLLGQDEPLDYEQILQRDVVTLVNGEQVDEKRQASLMRLHGPDYVYLVVTCRPLCALEAFVDA